MIIPRGDSDKRLTAEQLAAERLFWESMKDGEDPADIRACLARYPNGTYATLAHNRLERLTSAAKVVAPETTVAPEPKITPETVEESLGLKLRERRLVQSGLALLGFYAGPADGVFGARTRAAIGRWQASLDGPATGYLDAKAARELMGTGETTQARFLLAARATLSEALRAAAKISDADDRASQISKIARAQAGAGDIGGALATVQRISVDDDRPWALPSMLVTIARAQAEAGTR